MCCSFVSVILVAYRRRLKHVRESIDTACLSLNRLCDLLLETKDEFTNHYLSSKDTTIMLNGLKDLFEHSGDVEQIRIMTISPDHWGRMMVQRWFNCSEHQARLALLLKKNKGRLAFPEYSNGNKPLSNITINAVTEFYLQDGISRASPRKKDVIYINKEPTPIRYLEITGREAFEQFIYQHPHISIGRSSFYALRPRQIKITAPIDTCLCIYHENMMLLLKVSKKTHMYWIEDLFQAWNKVLKSDSLRSGTNIESINYKYLVNRLVCSIPLEECFNRHCASCNIRNPSDILLENVILDENVCVSWSQWKSVNGKVELCNVSGSMSLLINEIDDQWETFLYHSYITTEQKEYITTLRSNSSDVTYIVAQLDFAENFSMIHQREVQGYHWNNKQATVFTIHMKIGFVQKNIVIISDHMCHNTSFVYVAQQVIVDFIKENFPLVKKINYLRFVSQIFPVKILSFST